MIKIEEYPYFFDSKKLSTEEWELGIDEAGRGPVLGPMVYGVCFWPISLKKQLADIGFNDSKKLKEEDRNKFFNIIKKLNCHCMGYEVNVLNPEYLSNRMLEKQKYDLNKISHETAMNLIKLVLSKGINVVHCYLDTVGKPDTYKELLYNNFRDTYPQINFTVSEKADSKFPVVSAASICAKVTRDFTLKNWKCKEIIGKTISCDYGSGYPSDENTQRWLQENMDPTFGFVDLVRFSWKTCDNILKAKIKIDFGEEDNNTNCMIDQFTKKEKKGAFFTKIGLTNDFTL